MLAAAAALVAKRQTEMHLPPLNLCLPLAPSQRASPSLTDAAAAAVVVVFVIAAAAAAANVHAATSGDRSGRTSCAAGGEARTCTRAEAAGVSAHSALSFRFHFRFRVVVGWLFPL